MCMTALLGPSSLHPGPQATHPDTLSPTLCEHLLQYYNRLRDNAHGPDRPPHIYHRHDRDAPNGAVFLNTSAHTLRHVIVNARRITPRSSSAIVKVALPGYGSQNLAGDVVGLYYHTQTGYAGHQILAEVAWMVSRQATSIAGDPWNDL